MNAAEAKQLYNDNWCPKFSTFEALIALIRAQATVGKYTSHVYIDSQGAYDEVMGRLAELGYNVEDYNGGGNGILEISW